MQTIDLTENIKVLNNAILERIDELLHSNSIIANEMIYNSFKYSRISNLLDGREDGQFREYEDIEKETRLFKWKWWAIFRWWICNK